MGRLGIGFTFGSGDTHFNGRARASLRLVRTRSVGNAPFVGTKFRGNDAHARSLWSAEPHDKLRGDAGDDLLHGGSNSDDWADVATYEPPGYYNYPGAASGITAKLATGTVTGEGTDTLVGIEQLVPTSHDDILWGTRGPDNLTGGAGDDVSRGWGGADNLGDGPGSDSLYGGWGPDYLYMRDGHS